MPFVRYFGTRELITSHQAVELVTDGDMTVPASWTAGTGWTIGSGVATATAGASSDLEQDVVVTQNLIYNLTYDLTVTAGTITPKVAGTSGVTRSASGTYTESITAGSGTSPRLESTKDATFAGTLDNVSLSLGTNEWDLDFNILAGTEPEQRDTGGVNLSFSLNGQNVQAVVTNSPFDTYVVRVPAILRGGTSYLQWREFFRSTEEGEQFKIDIDSSATSSVPVNEKNAIMVGPWRFEQVNAIHVSPSFTCRVLSDV